MKVMARLRPPVRIGKQHRERQQAEFGQLERHRAERCRAEELRRRETEEQHHGHEGQARPRYLGAEKRL